jgi:hypothetical protein
VLAHIHFYIQIARRPTVAAGLSFATQANTVACIHTRRYFDRQLAGPSYPTLPEASVARVLDDRSVTAATRTRLLKLEEALRDADLPRPTAGFARSRRAPLRRATAVAGLALGELGDLDLSCVPEDRLVQVKLQLQAQIRAPKLLSAGITAPARRTKDVTEDITKNIAEGVAA